MASRFSSIRSHSFRGKRFHIFWRKPRKTKEEMVRFKAKEIDIWGSADWPTSPAPTLFMAPEPKDPMAFLDTILHETDHACLPDLDESVVEEHVASVMGLFRRMKMKVTFG